jgi:hypothetical protein
MGTIPTPRSFTRIVGDMADAFLSRFGIPRLRIGSPLLSLFEAAAMSDLRSTSEIFALLNSTDINTATGEALLRLAADEDIEPISESPASGTVTVTDTRFQKIATKIYQGLPAPIIGTVSLHVLDASSMPASGEVYVARGTSNFEGPLSYTSKTNNSSHWTLNLSSGTRRYHNGGEAVVLAQGGNRVIGAGSVVQTPQGSSFDAVQFSVLYPATIPDGEVEVQGVVVVARTPGVAGNIPAGAISGFLATPFSGATATNPAPFTNGEAAESDDELRERVKTARRDRAKGTALAIQSSVLGLTASDENKRITSSSLVRRLGQASSLFIDDGTGYEEKSEGVAVEFLADSAIGGEVFFQLSSRPIAKAYVESATTAPFALSDGSKLAVEVGGIVTEHTFSAASFRVIGNATAFEVVASINANAAIGFSARTSEGGSRVIVFAKADENEDIEVVAASATDANEILGFPAGRHDTLRLYRNDRPLTKDGATASLRSAPFSTWGALTGAQTLKVAVDGTPAVEYEFTNQDFIDADTGFVTLGRNTLTAWATVLNARIPGTTTTIDNGSLLITSNAGRTARAAVEILEGDLVDEGIFDVGESQGRERDYRFDRNRGQIELVTALEAGDRLSVGSTSTRGFVESTDISPVTLGADGHLYVALDGDAEIVSTGISSATSFTITQTTTGAWGARYRIAATGAFANAAAGDWLVIWDSDSAWADFVGMWRVVASAANYVEIDAASGATLGAGLTLPDVGLAVVRYEGQLQRLAVPADINWTADSFADAVNDVAEGLTASAWRTTRLRLRTNTFGSLGDIAVVTADLEGQKLALDIANANVDAAESEEGHVGSVASATRATPSFSFLQVSTGVDADQFTASTSLDDYADHAVQGLKALAARYGNNRSFSSPVREVSGTAMTLQRGVPQLWSAEDRFYLESPWALSPEDELAVLVDQNTSTSRFVVSMGRTLQTVGTTYGSSNAFKDGSGATLASSFGLDFDFNDFAVFMHARAKSHSSTASKSLLWRYKRLGAEGNQAVVSYHYPASPDASTAVTVDTTTTAGETRVKVLLPSSAAKTGSLLRTTTRLGYGYRKDGGDALPVVAIACGLKVTSASRTSNVTTLTLEIPDVTPNALVRFNNHGLAAGNQVWINSNTPGSFSAGLKTLTTVTSTTVSYAEVAINAGPTANIGTLTFDTQGEALFSGAGLVVGDLVRLADNTNIPATWRGQTIRITAVEPQYVIGNAETNSGSLPGSQTLSWQQLADTTKLSFYPLAGDTSQDIADAINDLSALCPVTATVLGSGAGIIDMSTRDELAAITAGYALTDGINWVKETVEPPDESSDYSLQFKAPVSGGLATDSDWENEEVRLVPTTTKNLVDWLNVLSVTGLSSLAYVEAADRARRLQLATATIGSDGSIEVQGGTANTTTAAVVGAATAVSTTHLIATFAAGAVANVHGRQWVTLDNTVALTKSGIFASTTTLSTITTNGTFTFSTSPNPGPTLYTQRAAVTDGTVQVERHGRFVAYVGAGHSSVKEGDWVYITEPTTPGNDIADANTGIFRVVRSNAGGFWVENASAVEESSAACDLRFFTPDSLMPGDVISISTSLWGANNKGRWTVTWVGDPTASRYFTDATKFQVQGPMTAYSGSTALGDDATKVLAIEAAPRRMLKRVHSLVSSQSNESLTDVKFDSQEGVGSISAAAGTVMTVLDKLDFPLDVVEGVDGYAKVTGLIGEASRVVYGDERNPTAYPGVISEGSNVNITGPLVRRVQLSLSLRVRTGVSKLEVANQVRSSVATVVNQSKIGESIALSDIVEAAAGVSGVLAITILSPEYSAGNDLISLQPFEKALVLNVDLDVLISFVDE